MSAIRTYELTKRFGRTLALDGVDLDIPERVVFGYLGPNGAGKTTTIRLLAGLIRPTRGRAEVLGVDVAADRDGAQREIGYLPGEFTAYPDLTGEQYLRYLAALRGGIRWSNVTDLAERFAIDLRRRIGTLSHGNRQKIGLVQAFMHEPRVLILDEPTIGLDPLVQREFVALVKEAKAAGRTVFLSSHIMNEVEAVADTVAILRQGRLVVVQSVEELKAQAVRRVDLTFHTAAPAAVLKNVPGVREAVADGVRAHLVVEGAMADLLRVAAPYGVDDIVTREADLEEIFMTYYEDHHVR